MKKEDIGLIVVLALIVFIGGFLILAINYTIGSISEQELMSNFNFTNWALIFFPSCASIMLIMMLKRKTKAEPRPMNVIAWLQTKYDLFKKP